MKKRIVLWAGLAIVVLMVTGVAVALDLHIALGRRFLELIRLVAVWR